MSVDTMLVYLGDTYYFYDCIVYSTRYLINNICFYFDKQNIGYSYYQV